MLFKPAGGMDRLYMSKDCDIFDEETWQCESGKVLLMIKGDIYMPQGGMVMGASRWEYKWLRLFSFFALDKPLDEDRIARLWEAPAQQAVPKLKFKRETPPYSDLPPG